MKQPTKVPMSIIELVIGAHGDQKDRAGKPYFDHLKRVATAVDMMVGPDLRYDATLTGLLHDILEDTDVTFIDLNECDDIPDTVVGAVRYLTKQDGQDYMEYIKIVSSNPIARAVKLADLRDNMDITRLPNELTKADIKRIQKYHKAYRWLNENGRAYT